MYSQTKQIIQSTKEITKSALTSPIIQKVVKLITTLNNLYSENVQWRKSSILDMCELLPLASGRGQEVL